MVPLNSSTAGQVRITFSLKHPRTAGQKHNSVATAMFQMCVEKFGYPGARHSRRAELHGIFQDRQPNMLHSHRESQQEFVMRVPVVRYVPNSNTATPPDSKAVHSITGDH